ncbi:splicing factor U2AF 35 kDa subunit isoform X3 [Patagioenas fasciata]|uniref:splicing factor U2AF 35 kDa subunit isoform X3 n=1 Tax=Patagioenas fasciata TaxID=372321 RepID=UPI003A99A988
MRPEPPAAPISAGLQRGLPAAPCPVERMRGRGCRQRAPHALPAPLQKEAVHTTHPMRGWRSRAHAQGAAPSPPRAGLRRSVSGAAAVTCTVGAGLSGGRAVGDGGVSGLHLRNREGQGAEDFPDCCILILRLLPAAFHASGTSLESTVHFISKLELVVMETDVLGCTTNRHLARKRCCCKLACSRDQPVLTFRQLDFKKNGTNVRFQVCLG